MAKQTDDLGLGQKAVQPIAPAFAPPGSWLGRLGGGEPAAATSGSDAAEPEPRRAEAGTLIIGAEISFIGDITACQRLVVEGQVEATVQRCHEVVVGKTGFFKGQARTDTAEVHGRVEGELIVRKLLRIRAAGQVSGTTIYGEIEVERGGTIVGQLEAPEGVTPPR